MINQYGLDSDYFYKKLKCIFGDIHYYDPEDLARELTRLALTANDRAVRDEVAHYHANKEPK